MAGNKINTYSNDANIKSNDKIIGTDAQTGRTKNFAFDDVVNFVVQSIGDKYVGNQAVGIIDGTLASIGITNSFMSYEPITLSNSLADAVYTTSLNEIVFGNNVDLSEIVISTNDTISLTNNSYGSPIVGVVADFSGRTITLKDNIDGEAARVFASTGDLANVIKIYHVNSVTVPGNLAVQGSISGDLNVNIDGVADDDLQNVVLTPTQAVAFRNLIGAGSSNVEIGGLSTQAAAGNHTHNLVDLGGNLTSSRISDFETGVNNLIASRQSTEVYADMAAFDSDSTTEWHQGDYAVIGTATYLFTGTEGTTSPSLSDDFHTVTSTNNGITQGEGDARYSQIGHTHTAANITDFDTEVSNNTNVSANTGKRTNTQNDARYSQIGHTHVAANITDFTSAVDSVIGTNRDTGSASSFYAEDGNHYTINSAFIFSNTPGNVVPWAEGGNNDPIPADKLVNAASEYDDLTDAPIRREIHTVTIPITGTRTNVVSGGSDDTSRIFMRDNFNSGTGSPASYSYDPDTANSVYSHDVTGIFSSGATTNTALTELGTAIAASHTDITWDGNVVTGSSLFTDETTVEDTYDSGDISGGGRFDFVTTSLGETSVTFTSSDNMSVFNNMFLLFNTDGTAFDNNVSTGQVYRFRFVDNSAQVSGTFEIGTIATGDVGTRSSMWVQLLNGTDYEGTFTVNQNFWQNADLFASLQVEASYIDINLGTSNNIESSFTITANNGTNVDETITNFDPVSGSGVHSTITVTDYAGMEVASFTNSAGAPGDDTTSQVGAQIVNAVNNNTETPTDFTATYNDDLNQVILTSVAGPVEGNWSVTVNNGSPDASALGNLGIGAITSTSEEVNEINTIKTVNGVVFNDGTTQTTGGVVTLGGDSQTITSKKTLSGGLNVSGYVDVAGAGEYIIDVSGGTSVSLDTYDSGGGSANNQQWYWRTAQGTNTSVNPASWADLGTGNQIFFDTTDDADSDALLALLSDGDSVFVRTDTGAAEIEISGTVSGGSGDRRITIESILFSSGTPGFSGGIIISNTGTVTEIQKGTYSGISDFSGSRTTGVSATTVTVIDRTDANSESNLQFEIISNTGTASGAGFISLRKE